MVFPDRLAAALSRLSATLDHLEAAADRHARAQAGMADLRDEFLVLQDDRARLAIELDGALARSRALLMANTDVAARLDRAGVAIQAVLAASDAGPDERNGPVDPAGAEPPR